MPFSSQDSTTVYKTQGVSSNRGKRATGVWGPCPHEKTSHSILYLCILLVILVLSLRFDPAYVAAQVDRVISWGPRPQTPVARFARL